MRRIQRARLWTGLALLGAMVASGHQAQASLSGISITGSGGTVTGSDPYTYYSFDVYLAPGYQWDANDFFQINGLVGVTPLNPPNTRFFHGHNDKLPSPGSTSFYVPPDDAPSYSNLNFSNLNNPIITITSPSPSNWSPQTLYTSSVEWVNTSGQTLTGDSSGFLGSFIILTSEPVPGVQPTVTFFAQSHTLGTQANPGGTLLLQNTAATLTISDLDAVVPEPSTLIFLVSAAAMTPIPILVRRWRRCGSALAA
jgi:hypothetical protein